MRQRRALIQGEVKARNLIKIVKEEIEEASIHIALIVRRQITLKITTGTGLESNAKLISSLDMLKGFIQEMLVNKSKLSLLKLMKHLKFKTRISL